MRTVERELKVKDTRDSRGSGGSYAPGTGALTRPARLSAALFNRWRPVALGASFLGLVVGAYFLGRFVTLPAAAAAQGDDSKGKDTTHHSSLTTHQDSRQVVAYIYGSIPITREELGEYLIVRQGAERLELMVNGRIIELACQKKGIVVTDAEIDAALAEDLKKMNIPSVKDFIKQVLNKNKATLYEYKEDVLRPKLALAKLCRGQVQVTEEDLHKAFEAYHGEKVECQMIMWPAIEKSHVLNDIYVKIRDSADEFDRVAKSQASPHLASTAGHIAPFARNTTGNEELENEAFKLQPGEISRVLETPQGLVVLKCIRHIEADKSADLEKERAKLEKEIIERKVVLEFPTVFKQLHDQANPQLFLGKHAQTEEELTRQAKEALTSDANPGLPAHPPHGN
jgi:parvulin-like peptidyl-prolyl isomerase